MALAKVSTVAQLQGFLADGGLRCLHIVAAESVRSAAAMLHLLEVTYGVIKPEPVGEEEIGGGNDDDKAKEEEIVGASSSEVDDGDEASCNPVCDSDPDPDPDDEWFVNGIDSLRRTARLANFLIEMADDVIPALAATPGDVATLHRLLDLGKDVRRAGLLVPGNAGVLAVTLGNKTQKLVSRAFNRKGGVPRSAAGRSNWIAQRRINLLDQVNGVLLTAVVFINQ